MTSGGSDALRPMPCFIAGGRIGQPRRSSPAAGSPAVPALMTPNRVMAIAIESTIGAPPLVLLVVTGTCGNEVMEIGPDSSR